MAGILIPHRLAVEQQAENDRVAKEQAVENRRMQIEVLKAETQATVGYLTNKDDRAQVRKLCQSLMYRASCRWQDAPMLTLRETVNIVSGVLLGPHQEYEEKT